MVYNIYYVGFFERVVSLWPLLIVLLVLLLTFLWYNQIRGMRRKTKRHDRRRMPGLINPVILLGIITLLILMLLILPFFFEKLEEYTNKKENKEEVLIYPENIIDATFIIENIDDYKTAERLEDFLKEHKGIKMVEVSHINKEAKILFDTTEINYKQPKNLK